MAHYMTMLIDDLTTIEKEKDVTLALSTIKMSDPIYNEIARLRGNLYFDFIRQLYFVLKCTSLTEEKIYKVLDVIKETKYDG